MGVACLHITRQSLRFNSHVALDSIPLQRTRRFICHSAKGRAKLWAKLYAGTYNTVGRGWCRSAAREARQLVRKVMLATLFTQPISRPHQVRGRRGLLHDHLRRRVGSFNAQRDACDPPLHRDPSKCIYGPTPKFHGPQVQGHRGLNARNEGCKSEIRNAPAPEQPWHLRRWSPRRSPPTSVPRTHPLCAHPDLIAFRYPPIRPLCIDTEPA